MFVAGVQDPFAQENWAAGPELLDPLRSDVTSHVRLYIAKVTTIRIIFHIIGT